MAIEQVKINEQAAWTLLHELYEFTAPLDDDQVKYVSAVEYGLRSELAFTLENMLLTSEELMRISAELNHSEIYLLMIEYDVEPLPNVEEIQSVSIENISQRATAAPCDRFNATALLLCDLFGIGEHDDIIIDLIRETPIQALLEDLVGGYEDRSWEQTGRQIIQIFGLIASGEFIARVARRIGSPVAAAILKRFSLILVPYAGQVYAALVIVAALKRNWNSIVC